MYTSLAHGHHDAPPSTSSLASLSSLLGYSLATVHYYSLDWDPPMAPRRPPMMEHLFSSLSVSFPHSHVFSDAVCAFTCRSPPTTNFVPSVLLSCLVLLLLHWVYGWLCTHDTVPTYWAV
ncbi:hypothetical protein BDV98DRAFT_281238 [Pterulicium gracile]|uniref:Uncharacterized protein n=1 Tax=Pterulicium gracile TaxID=1884261 RepID=A0A5C3QSN1_9AGAR|nr:hypothetical protein BDV98DRAFT_281238 [Pterula gracilis]